MDIDSVYKKLNKELASSVILKNEKMSSHTSFKIGGRADIFIKAKTIDDIKKILEISKKEDLPLYVIGNGSNILVKDNGIRGIVLTIDMNEIDISKKDNKAIVTVGAGVKLAGLSQILLKEELTGLEFASGIPGTIGGAIRMNAGAHGREMKDVVISTTYIDYDGNIHTISKDEHQFEYRNSIFVDNKYIILSSALELEQGTRDDILEKMNEYAKYRKEKQPISFPSAGSTFKRGEDFISAKLIDECGLKGYAIGDAKISELHAGFIINNGKATANEVLELINYVTEKVYEKFGKKIELEIEVIGE